MSYADRLNAEQVHAQMCAAVEKLSTLKFNKSLYHNITEFVIKTETLIDQASRRNLKALDEARSSIRWVEALYHSAPMCQRTKPPTLTVGSLPRTTKN